MTTQENKNNEIKEINMEDYLDEDEMIKNQKYVVMSILSPSFLLLNVDGTNKENLTEEHKKLMSIRGFKIRGSYATIEEAQKRALYLQKIDKLHNIFIGEVGKWLPLDDDVSKADDAKYAENKLNDLMKSYMEQSVQASEYMEDRKMKDKMNSIKNNMDLRTQTQDIIEVNDNKNVDIVEVFNELENNDSLKNRMDNELKDVIDKENL